MKFEVPKRDHLLASLELNCWARPLGRPRLNFHSGNVFQPKDNQRALFRALAEHRPEYPVDQECIVDMEVFFKKKKSTKAIFPSTRFWGDEDNIRKGINDGLVSYGHLIDDCLVLGGVTYKTFGPQDKVFINIYSVAGA